MGLEVARNQELQQRRLSLVVRGRVQGVFYRAFVHRAAVELGLVGWAKNLPNGTVEVVAEGEDSSLKSLLEYLNSQTPPAGARVDDIKEKWEPAQGELSGFRILSGGI